MVFPNGTLALRPEGELGLNRVICCVPPFFLQPTRSLGWRSQCMGRSSLKVEFKVESFVLQCLVTTSSSYSTAGHYFPTLPVPHTLLVQTKTAASRRIPTSCRRLTGLPLSPSLPRAPALLQTYTSSPSKYPPLQATGQES